MGWTGDSGIIMLHVRGQQQGCVFNVGSDPAEHRCDAAGAVVPWRVVQSKDVQSETLHVRSGGTLTDVPIFAIDVGRLPFASISSGKIQGTSVEGGARLRLPGGLGFASISDLRISGDAATGNVVASDELGGALLGSPRTAALKLSGSLSLGAGATTLDATLMLPGQAPSTGAATPISIPLGQLSVSGGGIAYSGAAAPLALGGLAIRATTVIFEKGAQDSASLKIAGAVSLPGVGDLQSGSAVFQFAHGQLSSCSISPPRWIAGTSRGESV